MAVLDHLEDRELKRSCVNGASSRSDGVMPTPWRLLDFFLTWTYRILEPFGASSKQT